MTMYKITTPNGVFGPYRSVETLKDRFVVDGSAHIPFSVVCNNVGECVIGAALPEDFPPDVIEPTPEPTPPVPTKEELLLQLQALQAQIEAMK